MKANLEKKLIKKYPTLFTEIYGDPRKTCMAWGVDCSDGWYSIIDALCSQLEPLCVAENKKLTKKQLKEGYEYRLSQVKEKYGTLRVYMSFSTDKMEDLIDEAEILSAHVCEKCGDNGELRSRLPWMLTLCNKCFFKHLSIYSLTGKIHILWEELCRKLSNTWRSLY